MYYRDLNIPPTSRGTIETFLGYNHNHRIGEGEFYDMKNLSSDEYPALSPRKPRECMLSLYNNQEWQYIDAKFEGKLEGQASGIKAVYTSALMSTEAGEKIAVSCNLNAVYGELAELTVTYYKNEQVYSEISLDTDGSEEVFEVEEGVTQYRVMLSMEITDIEGMTDDVVDVCITNINVHTQNWNIQGMLLKNGKLAYMVRGVLYYDGEEYDLRSFADDYRAEQQLISFGAYILIFPLGLYFNTNNPEDYGHLGAEYTAGIYEKNINIVMSDASGEEIVFATEKPTEPENGAYWLDTSEEKGALYKWSDSMNMWVSVASTYIRISMNFDEVPEIPFPQMFKEGDAVHMSTGIEDIDNGSIIVKQGNTTDEEGNISGGYIVVKGLLNNVIVKEVNSENGIFFRRKIPKMDFVCVSYNRVWGCYSGKLENGDRVNEIYASKLGDPKNWYCFDGASTDSYTLSIGEDGAFTGAFTYQGYPMFFKENIIYKVYGAYPAAYQLYTYNCRGVQKGCHKSLAVVNEYLMYKSIQDVCVFDGSSPTGVSQYLGNIRYSDAAAGACMGKYYLSMKNMSGEPVLFVFDLEKGLWHKEDSLYLEEFVYNQNGALYGRSKDSVYGFGYAEDLFDQEQILPEERVSWMAETGDMGFSVVEKKYINVLQIRMYADMGTEVDVYLKSEGEEWDKVSTLHGEGKTVIYRIPVIKRRTDGFRVRFEGMGYCRIYALVTELEYGSDRK